MAKHLRVKFCFGNHSDRKDARIPAKLLLEDRYDLVIKETVIAWKVGRLKSIEDNAGFFSARPETIEMLRRSFPSFERFPVDWTFNFCIGTAAAISGARIWVLEGPLGDHMRLPVDALSVNSVIEKYVQEGQNALKAGDVQTVLDKTKDFLIFMTKLVIARDATFVTNFSRLPEEAEEFFQTEFGENVNMLVIYGSAHSGLADKIRKTGCEVDVINCSAINPYVQASIRLANESEITAIKPTASDIIATVYTLLFPHPPIDRGLQDEYFIDSYAAVGGEEEVQEILSILKKDPAQLVSEMVTRLLRTGLDLKNYYTSIPTPSTAVTLARVQGIDLLASENEVASKRGLGRNDPCH